MMTVSAAVRFIPRPPARVHRRNTNLSEPGRERREERRGEREGRGREGRGGEGKGGEGRGGEGRGGEGRGGERGERGEEIETHTYM